MAAKDPARRHEIAVKAGKARARQFTPEYQRWAGAHQDSAARSLAGHKGAQSTIRKHGYPALEKKIGNNYLSVLERSVVKLFNSWGWMREVDYWIDYRIDMPETAYFVDFSLPGRRYIEVCGAWVHAQPGKRDHDDAKREALAQEGWRGLWLEESTVTDPAELASVIQLWLADNPPGHKERATFIMDLIEEIPF